MENVLPELYEGHAPITLQNAFHDALEAIESWLPGEREPGIFLNGIEVSPIRIVSKMLACTDILPRKSRSVLEAMAGSGSGLADGANFADGARFAMQMCRARQQSFLVWPVLQTSRDLDCSTNPYSGA